MKSEIVSKVIIKAEDILKNMNIRDVRIEEKDDGLNQMTRINIETSENAILIGENAETLEALSFIIKRTLEKEIDPEELKKIIIDVGNYEGRIIENIKEKLSIMIQRVVSFGTSVELPAMHPYDRMIVHAIIANRNDMESQSVGFGSDRRVILKPKPKDLID